MKVQLVSLCPTQAASKAGKIALTPELLAATGARYSRSNEGLEAIVSRINWKNQDASVDGIFRMVDYGHASIADMAPVAMFMDDISIVATTFLFAHCPTGSGQESSTRYIRFDSKGVVPPKHVGVKDAEKYLRHVKKAFSYYEKAMDIWTTEAEQDPSIMKIPKEIIEDMSESGKKRRERMMRNFAFDRSRVFLPIGVKTNMMLVMSARSWVEIISTLLSHPLPELITLGKKLKEELAFVTPRLIKHATYKQDTNDVIQHDFRSIMQDTTKPGQTDGAFFTLHENKKGNLAGAAKGRTNRYSLFGNEIRMTPVTFGWERITFVEMRDLNRHRTGQKMLTLKPNGFYNASDQSNDPKHKKQLEKLGEYGLQCMRRALAKLKKGDHTYIYETLLGNTYRFTHTTSLDKYIYEAELRTGVGAHYRYAMHLRNTLSQLYAKHPELKGIIKEGRAEPE